MEREYKYTINEVREALNDPDKGGFQCFFKKVAEVEARDKPWRWDEKSIINERSTQSEARQEQIQKRLENLEKETGIPMTEKSIGTPMNETFEAIREQPQAPYTDNLAAIRGEPTPLRKPLEQEYEPSTEVATYRSSYDKLYDESVTPLKENFEYIRQESRGDFDKAYEVPKNPAEPDSAGKEQETNKGRKGESIQKRDYDRAYDGHPHHVRPDSPGRVRETDYDK